jgi:ATP-dependent Clp protease ATP-binding subunit ClpC
VFRPEFINRLDTVIVFRSLNKDDIKQIVQLELDKVARRLEEHSIVLRATPEALDKLADLGFDPDMGARPLRRQIQQRVEDPLSDRLLSGEFEDNDTIVVELDGEEITLRRAEPEEAPPEESSIAAV